MIVEQRTYDLVPGMVAMFLERYEQGGLQVQCHHLGALLGYYTTEFGTLNRVIHLWAYNDLAERTKRRHALYADERWRAYLDTVMPLLLRQQSELLTPARFAVPSFARVLSASTTEDQP